MDGPRGIACLVLAAAAGAAACGGSGGVSSSAGTTVPETRVVWQQSVVEDVLAESDAPGALALVQRDGEEWFGAAGVADRGGTPITAASTFRIGSITKPLTAVLVLDAVARGALDLDAPIGAILPGVLTDGDVVTPRMLLEHSSGLFNAGDEGDVVADIPRIRDEELRAEAEALAARYLAGERVNVPDRVWVALAETHDRYFPPGGGSHYSNVGFQVLGMVLERATGRPMADLFRDRMTGRLGLASTSLAPGDAALPTVRGYRRDGAETPVDVTEDALALGNGASGGVVSTAEELLEMLRAAVDGRLLPSPWVDEMLAVTPESSYTYGLGWATYELRCGTFVGHGGAIAGMRTIGLVARDGSAGAVLAVNLAAAEEPDLLAPAEQLLCHRPR